MGISDKLAVAETLYRYAIGVDRKDWTLFRSLFADRVTIDFSSYNAGLLPPQEMDADTWVAGLIPLFTGFAATQHMMTNPLTTIDGDTAAITMYMRAHHVFDPTDEASWFTNGGYYEDTLKLVDGQWLLTGVRLRETWRAGDPGIMDQALVSSGVHQMISEEHA